MNVRFHRYVHVEPSFRLVFRSLSFFLFFHLSDVINVQMEIRDDNLSDGNEKPTQIKILVYVKYVFKNSTHFFETN